MMNKKSSKVRYELLYLRSEERLSYNLMMLLVKSISSPGHLSPGRLPPRRSSPSVGSNSPPSLGSCRLDTHKRPLTPPSCNSYRMSRGYTIRSSEHGTRAGVQFTELLKLRSGIHSLMACSELDKHSRNSKKPNISPF